MYFQDDPSHYQALKEWLKEHDCEVGYESKRFGYIDAKVKWENIAKLVRAEGKLGYGDQSFYKLEVQFKKEAKEDSDKQKSQALPVPEVDDNQLFSGPVHEAGYGIKLDEFRKQAARWTGLKEEQIKGQGTTVAVYDSGFSLSSAEVFKTELVIFI